MKTQDKDLEQAVKRFGLFTQAVPALKEYSGMQVKESDYNRNFVVVTLRAVRHGDFIVEYTMGKETLSHCIEVGSVSLDREIPSEEDGIPSSWERIAPGGVWEIGVGGWEGLCLSIV